jgi:osmotically-inducible protein OsmY
MALLAASLSMLFPVSYGAQNDRNNGPTADNQKDDRRDRKMTADIRKAVVGDHSLSTNAHNVKIITRNGAVTLRGRVKSEEEKRSIVAKAEQVAGQGKVTDELQIASDKNMEHSGK